MMNRLMIAAASAALMLSGAGAAQAAGAWTAPTGKRALMHAPKHGFNGRHDYRHRPRYGYSNIGAGIAAGVAGIGAGIGAGLAYGPDYAYAPGYDYGPAAYASAYGPGAGARQYLPQRYGLFSSYNCTVNNGPGHGVTPCE